MDGGTQSVAKMYGSPWPIPSGSATDATVMMFVGPTHARWLVARQLQAQR